MCAYVYVRIWYVYDPSHLLYVSVFYYLGDCCYCNAVQVNIRNEMNALLNDSFTHAGTTVGSSPKGRVAASPGRAKAETSSVSWSSSQRQHHLRPLSLPKPTIILPFSHSKPMLIEDADKMKTVLPFPPSPDHLHFSTHTFRAQIYIFQVTYFLASQLCILHTWYNSLG